MGFLLFGILASVAFYFSWSERSPLHRQAVRERDGVFLDSDMSAKFRELLDDPAMTDAKWREWLPVFEAADAEVRSKCPRLRLGYQSQFIKRILDDDCQPQV